MPDRVWDLISTEDGSSNHLAGVIPKLATLLCADAGLENAFLCTAKAVQVNKLKEEGAHFCGYRNLQMLLLALCDHDIRTTIKIPRNPTIPELQGLIEQAWDAGHNSHARIETGGILGTRKHIGPSEAEALLMSLGIACTGHALHGQAARTRLFDLVESYFRGKNDGDKAAIVKQTTRPPIFLQRPAHSITIIGIERLRSGKRRLLTFDPQWKPPSAMSRALYAKEGSGWRLQVILSKYRKTLSRYSDFELLLIDDVKQD